MKKGITKKKISISIDKDIYEKIKEICINSDAKISTKINSIITQYIKKEVNDE